MSLYAASVPTFDKFLGNLERWLDEAQAAAADRGYDAEALLDQRLSVDMFNLRRQIQAACDTPKLAASRVGGVEVAVHEDGEQDLASLRARIADVRAVLGRVDAETYDAAATTRLSPGFLRGASIEARNYVLGFALPNFFFHVNMVYAILRANGVKLGKTAYIGSLELVGEG